MYTKLYVTTIQLGVARFTGNHVHQTVFTTIRLDFAGFPGNTTPNCILLQYGSMLPASQGTVYTKLYVTTIRLDVAGFPGNSVHQTVFTITWLNVAGFPGNSVHQIVCYYNTARCCQLPREQCTPNCMLPQYGSMLLASQGTVYTKLYVTTIQLGVAGFPGNSVHQTVFTIIWLNVAGFPGNSVHQTVCYHNTTRCCRLPREQCTPNCIYHNTARCCRLPREQCTPNCMLPQYGSMLPISQGTVYTKLYVTTIRLDVARFPGNSVHQTVFTTIWLNVAGFPGNSVHQTVCYHNTARCCPFPREHCTQNYMLPQYSSMLPASQGTVYTKLYVSTIQLDIFR